MTNPTTDTDELRRLSACCPELNLSNYGPDDVEELNAWAIEVAQCIDRALAAPVQAVPATAEVQRLREALQFYADGNHFILYDEDAWDTISDEPKNFWEDEAGTAMVEDGSIAKAALAASPAAVAGPSDHLFELWWAEHMPESTQAEAWAAWTASSRCEGQAAAPRETAEPTEAAHGITGAQP